MATTSRRVQRILRLIEELTREEHTELADRLAPLVELDASDEGRRVAAAIRTVIEKYPEVLAALAK